MDKYLISMSPVPVFYVLIPYICTHTYFGKKCLQLPGTLALICSHAHKTSYPYGKGKVNALNNMVS